MIFKRIAILSLLLSFASLILASLASSGQEIERNPKDVGAKHFVNASPNASPYIKEWLVIGPFPKERDTDFLKSHGGEANIRPYEGMKLTAPDGKTHAWKRYQSQSDTINLQEAIGASEDAVIEGVFYVACNLLSPKDQRLEMIVNADLQVKIWLNSQLVHSTPIATTAPRKEDRLGIFLNKGSNHCLIKVGQYVAGAEGWWGFNIQVLDYEAYLRSLQLKLSVQRQKPGGKDHLVISARREPKSAIWQLPSFPLPVNIEIRHEITDEIGDYVGAKHSGSQNASPKASTILTTLKSFEDQPVGWTVPEAVDGTLGIIARQTDNLRKTQEARLTCKAHNIVAVTPRVGHWETYTVAKGLGGSGVVSIVQDKNRFLWFGLMGQGLCRYDGRSFKTFTKADGLPSNDVWTLFEDRKGNLWIGTMDHWTEKGSGVCKYDGKTFKTFTTKDGLVNDAVIAIYEDDRGHLWFGTAKGVSEFDGKTFRNYTAEKGLLADRVGAITQDKDGNLWFGHGRKVFSGGSGTTRYDGKSFKHFTTKDGLVSDAVASITTDKQGNLWFGTYGGISKYDGKTFQNFTTAEGLVYNYWISDVHQTKNGDLWIATWGGVSRYRDGKFQNFTTKDGLAHNWVMCIREDNEGNLWFGTWNSGVSRYDGSVESIPVDVAGPIPMMDTKGNLWFGVPGVGMGKYNGRNLQTFAMEDGLLDTDIFAICEDSQGNIWIGSFSGGLARYDGEKFQTFTTKDGLPSNSIWALYEDRKGVLWIGTQGGGVCTYDGVKFVQVAGRKELGGPWTWVSRIIEDRNGNMWFATANAGISRYDGKKFIRFTTENGLPNTSWGLLEDRKGSIWIATFGGICQYDGKTFQLFTTKDGLAENQVERAFEDRQGNLWFGVGTGGVHKFDGKNFQIFTIEDGLLNNFAWGIMEDEKGNMIFATGKGITIYTPPKQKIQPPIYLTEVVGDKVYSFPVETLHATSLQNKNNNNDLHATSLRIPSTTPRISFTYHAVSFKTKKMRYNYMLEGYDKAWNATWNETVSYENLKSGKYLFKVQAADRDLNYSEIASLPIVIKQPMWIYLLIYGFMAMVPIGYGTYRLGKYRQTKRAVAQQFNPYIAGKAVPEEMFFGREGLLDDIQKTIVNNCILIYGERRIGKTSLLHQLQRRLKNKDDATYQFIPTFIDLQWVKEEQFFLALGEGIIEACKPYFKGDLPLRHPSVGATGRLPLQTDNVQYSSRDLTRDIRTILEHLSKNTQKTVKIVLLLDEVDTLNSYNLKTNLALRSLFMGSFRENLTLVMAGFYLKKDWSDQGEGSPPFNFLSREIHVEPLSESAARELIEKPVKDFYSYEPSAVELILKESKCRPFWIQAFGIRLTNRVSSEGRRKILLGDVEAMRESVLAEIKAIAQSERKASLPSNLNDAIGRIVELEEGMAKLEQEVAKMREQ